MQNSPSGSNTQSSSFLIMDKALRPERLDVVPTSTDAARKFRHWKKTFEHYIAVFPAESNKLHVLINLVAPDVFDLFSDNDTYETAMETLTSCYIKEPNEVYARHLLATRKQMSGKSFNTYLNAL